MPICNDATNKDIAGDDLIVYKMKFLGIIVLTLLLLEPNVISICQQYRARPACTSMQTDMALYRWPTNFKLDHLDIPKIIMRSCKNGK